MKQLILFDLDGTLYDYNLAHQQGLLKSYKKWVSKGNDHNFDEFVNLYKESRSWVKRFLADTASSHSRALYFQKLIEKIYGKPDTSLITELLDAYYEGFYNSMKAFPGVKTALIVLKEKEYRLGIVTNMQADIQHRKLTFLEIGNDFDFIITSEAVDHEKPHPHIFFHALAITDGTPKTTVMVGDSFLNDIEPASWIGITPIWYNPKGLAPPIETNAHYYSIKHFDELVETIFVALPPKTE
ncbi:MAG: HAD family hydrolase [Candidatus Thorarchaeota archaeon]